jgi:CRISPR/Cas system CMR subunit Cmr6 (Cas7 group RAMP superfamily)
MATPTKEKLSKASGRLLAEAGPGELTPGKFFGQPKMHGFDIFTLIRNEAEIFEQLLLELEKELKAIMKEISTRQDEPALEFEMLFKQLHQLFIKKPYYLTVIFDKDLHLRYCVGEEIITRIKGVAKAYITNLIERGKAQQVFATDINSKILVRKILGSFKAMMNDMQLTDKMIRDFKKYRSVND